MAKAKKALEKETFTKKQLEQLEKLQVFMKKQAKDLDFSLNMEWDAERKGRNEAIPTASMCVDLITGGGIPKHRLTVIVGPEHSGKTTIMQSAMASSVKQNTLTHYIDLEGAADPAWMKRGTGIDFTKYPNFFPIPDMPTGEDAFRYLTRTFKETSELGLSDLPVLTHLGCLDSIPSLVPEDLLEDDEQGNKPFIAIMLSKWAPIVRAQLKSANASLIMINQIRNKVRLKNPYENPEYEPGGNAIRYMTDLKINITQVKPKHVDGRDYTLIEKDGLCKPREGGRWEEPNPDGTVDSYVYRKIKTPKNRVYSPLQETFIRICTSKAGGEGLGIDPVFDTLYFLEETGQLVFHDVENIEIQGAHLKYFDIKNDIEKNGDRSELRAMCLAQLNDGSAWQKFATRKGGNLGKPDTEEDEKEE